jgi:hypothetical protein
MVNRTACIAGAIERSRLNNHPFESLSEVIKALRADPRIRIIAGYPGFVVLGVPGAVI